MDVDPTEFLRLARVKSVGPNSVNNVYTVGPFGSRVSFAYQQRRSLTLVASLISKKVMTKGQVVAVIGAGISGTTTAIALMRKGLLVDIYERQAKPIQLQAPSSHRYVHPSINFWPKQVVDPVTDFPFMNWHADSGENIAISLRTEFESEVAAHGINAHFNVDVNDITNENTKVKVSCVPMLSGAPAIPSKLYDALVLCVGFGTEKVEPDHATNPYWEIDPLHAYEGMKADVRAVSGLGDGAIIDALRQVHSEFRKGELFYEVAVSIEGEPTSRATAENFKLFLDEPRILDPSNSTLESVAEQIQAQCLDVLSRLPSSLKSQLDKSIQYRKAQQPPNNVVTIIGAHPGPFQSRIAPIHLILLAHAVKEGVISWKAGRLEDSKIVRTGHADEPAPNNCIVRHGTMQETSILQSAELHEVVRNQTVMGNWVNFDFQPTDWLENQDIDDHNERQHHRAQHFAARHFSNGKFFNLAVNSKRQWEVQYESRPRLPLPSKLCGRDVVILPRAQALKKYSSKK